MLSSWLFQTILVSGGKASNRLIVSLQTREYPGRSERVHGYIPDLDVPAAIDLCPHAENIFTTPDAQNGSTNLLSGLHELIANDGQQKVLPIAVSHAFLQPHNPFPASFICLIFPDGPDAILENMIVGDGGQQGRSFEM